MASWTLLQETYRDDKHEVVDLFASPADRCRHTRGFAHQISLHSAPNMPHKSTCASRVQLQTKRNDSNSNYGVLVDQVSCIAVVDLDHAFYFIEYIRREENPSNLSNNVNQTTVAMPSARSTSPVATSTELMNDLDNTPVFHLDDLNDD